MLDQKHSNTTDHNTPRSSRTTHTQPVIKGYLLQSPNLGDDWQHPVFYIDTRQHPDIAALIHMGPSAVTEVRAHTAWYQYENANGISALRVVCEVSTPRQTTITLDFPASARPQLEMTARELALIVTDTKPKRRKLGPLLLLNLDAAPTGRFFGLLEASAQEGKR